MPRPRKAIDYDDEIMKVEAQLIRCDKTKAELLERRQELLNAKRETDYRIDPADLSAGSRISFKSARLQTI